MTVNLMKFLQILTTTVIMTLQITTIHIMQIGVITTPKQTLISTTTIGG